MQVTPINFNYNNYNRTGLRKVSNAQTVNFQGLNNKLIPAETRVFNDTAKKIYLKMQQYLRLLGAQGNVKNIKIKTPEYPSLNQEIFMTINKDKKGFNIRLFENSPRYSDGHTLLNANFNNDGQMIGGKFEDYIFERKGKNLRRMTSLFDRKTYLPEGANDREWSRNGRFAFSFKDKSDAIYQIFVELARLNTSILK